MRFYIVAKKPGLLEWFWMEDRWSRSLDEAKLYNRFTIIPAYVRVGNREINEDFIVKIREYLL